MNVFYIQMADDPTPYYQPPGYSDQHLKNTIVLCGDLSDDRFTDFYDIIKQHCLRGGNNCMTRVQQVLDELVRVESA
jgi:hypothetical protein